MRKLVFIGLVAVAGFVAQFVLYNIFGYWFKPDIVLLCVLFFSIRIGIRHGLMAAVLGGFISDSFHTGIFGLHIFSFMICAYLAVVIKQYVYPQDDVLDVFLPFVMTAVNILVSFGVMAMFIDVNFHQVVVRFMIPEVIATTAAAFFIFPALKTCVLKFSV